jgi:hypothetical protein
VAVVVLSVGTDQVFHALKVYPPFGQPMWDSEAQPAGTELSLRVRRARQLHRRPVGAASADEARDDPGRDRVRPQHPRTIGSVVMKVQGPLWYPISIAVTALPFGWLGGWLASRKRA